MGTQSEKSNRRSKLHAVDTQRTFPLFYTPYTSPARHRGCMDFFPRLFSLHSTFQKLIEGSSAVSILYQYPLGISLICSMTLANTIRVWDKQSGKKTEKPRSSALLSKSLSLDAVFTVSRNTLLSDFMLLCHLIVCWTVFVCALVCYWLCWQHTLLQNISEQHPHRRIFCRLPPPPPFFFSSTSCLILFATEQNKFTFHINVDPLKQTTYLLINEKQQVVVTYKATLDLSQRSPRAHLQVMGTLRFMSLT